MTNGPQERSSSGLEFMGVVDPCLTADSPLGAKLREGIAPEDPDDRQYWLWDVDDLPTEDEECLP